MQKAELMTASQKEGTLRRANEQRQGIVPGSQEICCQSWQ